MSESSQAFMQKHTFYQIQVLEEFLNDKKQEYRINGLQKQIDDLMKAIGGYVIVNACL